MKAALLMLLVAVTAVYHTEGQEDRWNVALASDTCGSSGLCANLAWFKRFFSRAPTFANEQECREKNCCHLPDKWERDECMEKAKQQG